ncbi:MAG: cytochrome C oxidase subunit IV family protein [Bacteroidales bacterium]|nr:cytochrome C oxidase subunit IV family protein [Bacteroidales bacterium]MCF8456687.1 cytochrome C oxidase subunit IV family protein [Bacteroidales bacterium]
METEKHIVDDKKNILIWVDLLILTFVTVEIAQFDFKTLTILIALGVATFKTILVGYFFMHLKFENRFFKTMVFLCLFVLIAVLAILFIDYSYR